MTFQKGRKKTGGRKKGTRNKMPETVKELIRGFLMDNGSDLQLWFDQLEPLDKIKVYIRLSSFIIPRPNQVEMVERSKGEQQTFEIGGQVIYFD